MLGLHLSMLRMWLFCIPAVLIGNHVGGVVGIMWAILIANILSGLVSVIMVKKIQTKALGTHTDAPQRVS